VSGLSSGEILSQTTTQYETDLNCKWIISSGYDISVQFSRFATEFYYDFVYIDTCTSSLCADTTRLAEFAGHVIPPTIFTSTTGYLQISFTSDASFVDNGFALQWSVDTSGCAISPCHLCVAGKYKINTGNAECTDCKSNQYCSEVGAITNVCQACPANSDSASASTE